MPASAYPVLSEATLARLPACVAVPAYDRARMEIGIVHFGPGAFHRAHQASYVDSLLARDPRWAISAVSLRSGALAAALAAQDCLYTLAEIGAEERLRVIGALKEYLVAGERPDAVFARLVSPAVRLVTITVSEKGYCLDAGGALDLSHPDIAGDLRGPAAPASLIGWLAEGLWRRRAAGLAPFTVMSCDNLADNGPKLRRAVAAFARARGLDDLAAWTEDAVRFPATMVDSITPATDEALKARVAAKLGLRDAAPVQREPFTQWVIEDVLGEGAPDLAAAGAILTPDVAMYERAKLRLLNGAHSALAYLGLLAGHETVYDAMQDAPLAGFVERMMREEIAPTLHAGFDIGAYIDAILARLRNPALKHRLVQIASDGSQKLPYRLLSPIADSLAAGRSVTRLAVPVAAWMRFAVRETGAGRALNDPLAERLARTAAAGTGEAAHDVSLFLALRDIFPLALIADTRFTMPLIAAYRNFA